MKKVIIFLSLFLICFGAFAYSDFSIRLAPVYTQEIYSIDGEQKGDASDMWEIGIENYNFLGETNRFGFFESLSIRFDGSSRLVFGPAFAHDVGEYLRFQLGTGLNMIYKIEDKSSSYYIAETETYVDNEISDTRIKFGLSTDFQLKITPHKRCSPVIGFTFSYNPLCIGIINEDNTTRTESYDYYHRFGLSQYISFCLNLE